MPDDILVLNDIAPFRVEMHLKNNRLVRLREARGWNQREMANAVGVMNQHYNALECLRMSPRNRKGWRPIVRKIAEFYKMLPEDIFPEALDDVTKTRAVLEVQTADISEKRRYITEPSNPLIAMIEREDLDDLYTGLSDLKERHRLAVCANYGLMEFDREHTLVEIGKMLGVSRSRAGQIIQEGIMNLRWGHYGFDPHYGHDAEDRHPLPFGG